MVFFEEVGKELIYNQIAALSKLAKEQFTALDLLLPHTVHRKQHSSIFNIKGDKALFQKLNDHKIICSPRGGGIRVSFHYYNTMDDLNKIVEIL